MRDQLLDIIKHTNGLVPDASVRVTGTDTETTFETMDNDRTLIIRAVLKTPEPAFKGEFGMSNLGLLQGFLNHAPYRADGSTLEIKRRVKDDVNTPVSLEFKTEGGKNPADFRFMAANLLPAQPFLKNKKWDVDIEPTDSKVQEFSALAGMMAGIEPYFNVIMNGTDLEFHIGDAQGSNHSASMVFASDIDAKLGTSLYWPSAHVLNVLKVGKSETPRMQIMAAGALQITLVSDYATYEMTLPARKK